MPKSKSRKSKSGSSSGAKSAGPGYGSNFGKTSGRTNLIAGVFALMVVGASGFYWWDANQTGNVVEAEVATLAQEGQAKLENVRTVRSQGQEHLGIGQTKRYVEPFPTSGDHASSALNAGLYNREMPKMNLVHNLEHGNIVIYYDAPGDAAMAKVKAWASQYTGGLDGVVAVLSPGLGEAVVMTAWTKLLRLETFDEAAAAAFMDAFRGRGPERVVR